MPQREGSALCLDRADHALRWYRVSWGAVGCILREACLELDAYRWKLATRDTIARAALGGLLGFGYRVCRQVEVQLHCCRLFDFVTLASLAR